MKDLNQSPVPAAIARLRADLAQVPISKGGRRPRIPEKLKRRVAATWQHSQMSIPDFAAAVSVGQTSIWRWSKLLPRSKKKGVVKKARKAQPSFKRVHVVDDPIQTRRGFTIEGPGGIRVSGLGMDEVARLWKHLC